MLRDISWTAQPPLLCKEGNIDRFINLRFLIVHPQSRNPQITGVEPPSIGIKTPVK